MRKIIFILALIFVSFTPLLTAASLQTPQPPAHEGFVPVDQLPGDEQLPAAPLVATAYGVAWAAVFIYVWFLWRRLGRVERELADVASRLEGAGRK
jgi:CcmD family protein